MGIGEGKSIDLSQRVAESSTKSTELRDMEELLIESVDLDSNQLKSKGNTGKKNLSEKGQAQFNKTVACNKEAARKQRDQAKAIWDGIIQTAEYGSSVESSISKKSWTDEVEDESNALGKKKSIWDDFDLAKLANVEYKLEYVMPTKKGDIVEIEMEDIRYEITYWGNAVVCYMLGAHPPFTVIQGYIQRL
ncbi:hypothetical protein RDI58_019737 [Solanum bulbocastanum]|uniref:Uncharacterized protein n=1 Tax=Solanum bulbocastanum TaxID=147425 RepID=A0AAN8TDV6_SOLBU